MSLESNQFQHDGLQVAKNNLSGSNDPHQLQHDLNEQLIKGAKRAAALQDLDIDEADYFALQSSRARYSPEQEARIQSVMGVPKAKQRGAIARARADVEKPFIEAQFPNLWASISISGKIHRNLATIRADCRI